MHRRRLRQTGLTIAACLSVGVGACTVNPVTGQRQVALVGAAEEVAIGEQQYTPSQQMQGGLYVRDPELTAYVRDVGQRLAAVSDRDLPYEFVVLNSSVPNAWALPGGKIAINRGLLVELDSEAELAAVLGHEIVHAAARHGAQAMQRGMLLQAAVAATAVAASDNDFSALAMGAASLGAQLIHMSHGRGDELEADEYGMLYMSRAGYDPAAAVSLQETFVRLSQGRDQGGFAALFASHPPSAERVARNRETAATLPAGTLGREVYQTATADLRRDTPGYEALDAGREALAEGNVGEARRQAALAQDRIPDEPDVEALLGDIDMTDNEPARALPHYQRAVALHEQFFLYHVKQGNAHLALDQPDEAATEFERSIALLPTAAAYLGLGRVAERRRDTARAIEQYRRAAEAPGPTGEAARAALVRLDLPQNPGQYLSLATGRDANGQLLIEIANPTSVAVTAIRLRIGYRDSAGQVRQVARALDGTLAAGDRRRIATGLGPFVSSTDYEVVIDAAEVATQP